VAAIARFASQCSRPPYAASRTKQRFDDAASGGAPGTDVFTSIEAVSLYDPLNLGGLAATSASLDVQVAGIDLGWDPAIRGGPVDASFGAALKPNSAAPGGHVKPTDAHGALHQRKITTPVFRVNIASSVDARINRRVIAPETACRVIDEHAVDHARLTVETASVGALSAPFGAPLALLAGEIQLSGLASRRNCGPA
jgi:hypothetical protein